MKFLVLSFFCFSVSVAQNKEINFFGNKIIVNNACEVSEFEAKYDNNTLMWTDRPPAIFRGILTKTMKATLSGRKVKQIKDTDVKVTLLNTSWDGKYSQYQAQSDGTVMNFIQLFGKYNNAERMLILIYKTTKPEAFRVPAYFDFLVK